MSHSNPTQGVSFHEDFEQVAKRALDAVFARVQARNPNKTKDEVWDEAVYIVLCAVAPTASHSCSASAADWAAAVQKELFALTRGPSAALTLTQAKNLLKDRMRRLIYCERALVEEESFKRQVEVGNHSMRKRVKPASAARKRTWEDCQ